MKDEGPWAQNRANNSVVKYHLPSRFRYGGLDYLHVHVRAEHHARFIYLRFHSRQPR